MLSVVEISGIMLINILIGPVLLMAGSRIVIGSSASLGRAYLAVIAASAANLALGFVTGFIGVPEAPMFIVGLGITIAVYSAIIRTNDRRTPSHVQSLLILLLQLPLFFVGFVVVSALWVATYLFVDPPTTALMITRAAQGQTIRHEPVPIEHMSPDIISAVIAADDANFCSHDGFNVEAAPARGVRRRASTISQQAASNLFLWPQRSRLREAFETYFTALTEFMWPKRRIMEAYLNNADWGDGNFGIEAAARADFGVGAAELTPAQAAVLVAVLPNPNRWRADQPGPYVRRRAASIVERARVVRDERTASCVLNLDRAD